ncbi:MAG: xanthine dehydrogenase family protein subunit M [Deltaproteobacteria bacterium]|nr:xanthine dehydrogenase family protein subunit M [Deltaproteobacteria bacterium]
MGLSRFDYYAPETIGDACELAGKLGEGTMFMAGGTDLLIKAKRRLLNVSAVIDIKKIKELNKITFDEKEGLVIGSTVTLTEIENHPLIKEKYPAIADAAAATANVQIRNMASAAGNLCNAAPSAENAPVLLAMGANVTVEGRDGKRIIPLDKFFTGPGQTVLKQGELLTAINVPVPPKGAGTSYQHISARGKVDISSVCVGAMLVMKGDICEDARIFLGAVAPTPMMAKNAQELLKGKKITEELLQTAGIEASKECKPITDMRASKEYRTLMVAVLTGRAIDESRRRAAK